MRSVAPLTSNSFRAGRDRDLDLGRLSERVPLTVTSTMPELADLMHDAVPFALPLTRGFRGLAVREGLLIRGPSGWGEFAPFADYSPHRSARRQGFFYFSVGINCVSILFDRGE